MSELTKAPERIWVTPIVGGTIDDEMLAGWRNEGSGHQFIRADIAAKQVREAREAILDAIASIPHPDDLGEAEGLEKAYRAAEVAADMPAGSVRSIKAAVNEAYERAAEEADTWYYDGEADCITDKRLGKLIRALKSDDASDAHRLPVSSECNTPSPGRAVSSEAPAAMRDRLKRHIIQVTEGIRHLSVDDADDLIAEIGDEIAEDRTEDAINGAILDGLRWGYVAAVAVEMGGGAMLRVIVPGGVGITHEWSSERDAKRQLDAALDAIATVRDMETTNDQ